MNYKITFLLLVLSVLLSGCLKPLSIGKRPDNFKPVEQRALNIIRKDNG